MTRNRKVGMALIGYGAWGSCHAGAIANAANADLVAIAANSEESCRRASEAHPGVTVVSDYRELLVREDVEVCDVVLPSHLHHEVASAVLDSRKHCLLEKPMCLSIDHCQDLIERAKSNQVLLAIGHELRLSSLWSKVKDLIDEGFIGDPKYVLVELSRNPYRLGSGGWRYDIDRVGNWILEEPIHFFDFARWYLASVGEPVSVYALANSRQLEHPELQDNFSALVQFSGGAYAVISQTLAAFEHHQTVKVTGSKGALWASWSGAKDRTRHPTFSLRAFDGAQLTEVPIEKITGEVFELQDQIALVADAVLDGKPLQATGNDGLWSVGMCLAAQKSVESGLPVNLSEVMG
jgi:myo-inositol 2-dehydrogenase/D-chiro-inositol 1-dehydrogenase